MSLIPFLWVISTKFHSGFFLTSPLGYVLYTYIYIVISCDVTTNNMIL